MSESLSEGIVIVGGGQAGACAAAALRAAAYTGGITLVGGEVHLPYERPQLSKELLLDCSAAAKFMRTQDEWRGLGVDVLTGVAALDGDIGRRVLSLSDGRELRYDRLLLATGTKARRALALEGGPVPLHYLRSIDDAIALRQAIVSGCRIVLIGGGVIGLEVAAAAVERGCAVVVIEAQDQVLAQVGSSIISEYFARLHRQHGVEIKTGVTVERAEPGSLVLSDGAVCAADIVVVGIGVDPVCDLAGRLGLDIDGGIRVDASGMTACDTIYSAGDVAVQWNAYGDRWMRIENWANAQNQAVAAAKSMLGHAAAYDAVPWFWSDQYRVNLQVAGNLHHVDPVLRVGASDGVLSVLGLRDGTIVGAATINNPREMAVLRRAIGMRAQVERASLESQAFDLRQLLKK